ncbi:MAG: hypothetical protein ACRDXX_09310 [Stackebrandtia sp.]
MRSDVFLPENRPRFGEQRRFFEIWFAVLFDSEARRTAWIRYDLLRSAAGAGHAIVWAGLSDERTVWKKRAFKQVLPLTALRRDPDRVSWAPRCEIKNDRWSGSLPTPDGELDWQLEWLGVDSPLPPREPWPIRSLPLPTRVVHCRDRERVVLEAELDGEQFRIDGHGVQKHIWGRRRVERLFWLYCPRWHGPDGGMEAIGVSVRGGDHPAVTVAAEVDGHVLTGNHGLQLLANRLRVRPERQLEFEASGLREKIVARARCEPDTLIGYLYRDPSGVDIPVAQSDLGECELEIHRRDLPGRAWRKVRTVHSTSAALEFHGETVPGIRYLEWLEEH